MVASAWTMPLTPACQLSSAPPDARCSRLYPVRLIHRESGSPLARGRPRRGKGGEAWPTAAQAWANSASGPRPAHVAADRAAIGIVLLHESVHRVRELRDNMPPGIGTAGIVPGKAGAAIAIPPKRKPILARVEIHDPRRPLPENPPQRWGRYHQSFSTRPVDRRALHLLQLSRRTSCTCRESRWRKPGRNLGPGAE